jgi:D-amino-acid dehydrogenase
MAKILVIGAGINGVLTAKAFQSKGFDVTILEEKPKCGQRATFANGCQLSFAHTTPIFIKPSVFSKTFGKPWFLQRNTKSWLALHGQSQVKNNEKFNNLTSLALESSLEFDTILEEYSTQLENIWHDFGTAYIFANPQQFQKRKQQFEIQKTLYNIPYKELLGSDIPDCDFALAGLSKNFQHAIFTPVDKTLNAVVFTEIMAKEFQKAGGRICYDVKIDEIVTNKNEVVCVKTNVGNFQGYDFYVYAAGASGLGLIQNFCPNVQPVTGYSLTFDVSYSNHCPFVNVVDFTNKIVYSRHGDLLRVAGLFDVEMPKSQPKRIDDLYNIVIATFPILKRHDVVHRWSENRVFSADEMPVCKKILRNFGVNTAHGHLGITLSAGMAKKMLNIFLDN